MPLDYKSTIDKVNNEISLSMAIYDAQIVEAWCIDLRISNLYWISQLIELEVIGEVITSTLYVPIA